MNSLTLLQRGVIQRLRERGFNPFADRALIKWRTGRPLGELLAIAEPASALDRELRDDVARANEQAIRRPD